LPAPHYMNMELRNTISNSGDVGVFALVMGFYKAPEPVQQIIKVLPGGAAQFMEFPDIGLGDHDVPGHLTVAVEQDLGGGELPHNMAVRLQLWVNLKPHTQVSIKVGPKPKFHSRPVVASVETSRTSARVRMAPQ